MVLPLTEAPLWYQTEDTTRAGFLAAGVGCCCEPAAHASASSHLPFSSADRVTLGREKPERFRQTSPQSSIHKHRHVSAGKAGVRFAPADRGGWVQGQAEFDSCRLIAEAGFRDSRSDWQRGVSNFV